MHEASLAKKVIESLELLIREGRIQGKVRKVYLKFGELHSESSEHLISAFDLLIADSSIPSARLEVEKAPGLELNIRSVEVDE